MEEKPEFLNNFKKSFIVLLYIFYYTKSNKIPKYCSARSACLSSGILIIPSPL